MNISARRRALSRFPEANRCPSAASNAPSEKKKKYIYFKKHSKNGLNETHPYTAILQHNDVSPDHRLGISHV